MKQKFGEIVSKLDLSAELKEGILSAWDEQVEQNKKEIRAEQLSESAGSKTDMAYVVAAADTIVTETLNEHKAVLEAERRKVIEAKEEALKTVRKAKQLYAAAKRSQANAVKSDSVMLEALSKLVQDVLKEHLSSMHRDRKAEADAIAADRVKLLKQTMSAEKIMENKAKAATNLVVETLTAEIKELHKDRNENKRIMENSLAEFGSLLESTLSDEMKELHEDRKVMMESVGKMEDLVIRQLTEELSEFQEDRRALTEERNRLTAEANRKIAEAKANFVNAMSKQSAKLISETLHTEISSLREGIKEASQNTFGRRIFEAFVSEFTTSVFDQNTTAKKLSKKLEESAKNIEKLQKIVVEQEQQLNKKEKALMEATELSKRKAILGDLVSSLGGPQRRMMVSLLESVRTENLSREFNRYLPQVLDTKATAREVISESSKTKQAQPEKRLLESNGNRPQPKVAKPVPEVAETDGDIQRILTSAGIGTKSS